jgi:septum formation protein
VTAGGREPVRPERLLLCSASPRRADLLTAAGIPFERGPAPGVDETPRAGLPPDEAAEDIARRKAIAAAARAPGRTVLAADTVVVLDGEILGKPKDAADARAMLARLSGREHSVVTAVAVARDARVESARDAARVEFRALTSREIADYVAAGEPLDKAGAYAIQGGAAAFVARRAGEIDTVVGLPVRIVADLVRRISMRMG